MDPHEGAVQQTSVTAFVAVGTPSQRDGGMDGSRKAGMGGAADRMERPQSAAEENQFP